MTIHIATEADSTALARTTRDVDGLGTITIVSPETLARQTALIAERKAFGPVTEENLVEADKLVGRIAVHDRDVEADREKYKRPFLEAGRFVDEAAKDAKIGDRTLVVEVAAVRRTLEQRIAAEAAERERIEAEAAAKLARAEQLAEEARTVVGELEENATPEEAAALAELRADAHQAATVAQHEAVEAGGAAWIRSAQAESRVLPKISTGSRKVMKLVIDDASKIPHMVNGKQCTKPIEATIRKLLDAGVDVGGCRLVEDTIATAGRR
jgi:hypothetical protein